MHTARACLIKKAALSACKAYGADNKASSINWSKSQCSQSVSFTNVITFGRFRGIQHRDCWCVQPTVFLAPCHMTCQLLTHVVSNEAKSRESACTYTLKPNYDKVLPGTKITSLYPLIRYKCIFVILYLTSLILIYFVIADNLLYPSLLYLGLSISASDRWRILPQISIGYIYQLFHVIPCKLYCLAFVTCSDFFLPGVNAIRSSFQCPCHFFFTCLYFLQYLEDDLQTLHAFLMQSKRTCLLLSAHTC